MDQCVKSIGASFDLNHTHSTFYTNELCLLTTCSWPQTLAHRCAQRPYICIVFVNDWLNDGKNGHHCHAGLLHSQCHVELHAPREDVAPVSLQLAAHACIHMYAEHAHVSNLSFQTMKAFRPCSIWSRCCRSVHMGHAARQQHATPFESL